MRLTGFLGLGLALVAVATVTSAVLYAGVLTSEAVQAPRISLDMDPAGNMYDPATNTMSVGAVDACLASEIADPTTHVHTAHVIIHDVEDVVGWQARLNYDGDRMRPSVINFLPFTDTTTGQGVAFVNLPKDAATQVHRNVVSATAIPPQAAGPQSALVGAVYNGEQDFDISPDTPAKAVPDDTSYSAPTGGVLAALTLQVLAGEAGNPSLFMNLDVADLNGAGSDVQIFNGSGIQTISIPKSALSSGYHAEGGTACAVVPTPASTPSPQPTPGPEPTPSPAGPTPVPPPPGNGGPFDPQVAARYSDTSPGSHPDVASLLYLGLGPDGQPVTADDTGDYNFAGIVNFSPSAPADADIPDGAILGTLVSTQTMGLLNNTCANKVEVPFTFMEGTTDIANTVDMLPFGVGNELGVMAGDNPPFDGVQAIKPPPAVTKYPAFLNAIFDHDWVDYGPDTIPGNADDNNGPLPPIKPRFRAVATTYVGYASLWVILQQVSFEPGTDLPRLPALDPAYGYPSVTVFQTASAAGSATPPIAGPITSFCSATKENSFSYGTSHDNPDTPGNEAGAPLRTLPAELGTAVTSIFYAISQRDADGDGYENTIDACPFHVDTVWNPRDQTKPIEGDGDVFVGAPSPDGIPDTCDPTPNVPSGRPIDHDQDGFPNGGDNCPLQANPDQADRDRNAEGEEVGDGIGDVCDTPGTDGGFDSEGRPIPARSVAGNGPDVPDGEAIVCVRTLTVTVGGPNDAEVSECLSGLPPQVVVEEALPVSVPGASTSDSASGSGSDPVPEQTPAVLGVTSLPRTGGGAGSVLPGPDLVFAFAAGIGAATAAVGVRVWRTRRR